MPVSAAVLERIKELETSGAIRAREERLRTVFKVGQGVRINSRPLADFHATMQSALDLPFDQVDADTRVRCALALFGGATVVDLQAWQVEAAADRAPLAQLSLLAPSGDDFGGVKV